MKKLLSGLLTIVMLVGLAGCGKAGGPAGARTAALPVYPEKIAFEDVEAKQERQINNPVSKATLSAVNKFSYNTAAPVLADVKTNGCYSPLSLYYALALAATGAGGGTRDELLALLGTEDAKELSGQCGNLYRLLYTDNEYSRLKIADSLWLADELGGRKVVFKDGFIKNARENFFASLFTVDFADKSTGGEMSRWISQNTNGALAPELKTDAGQIMAILNTVYFHDEWINRFDTAKTKADAFHLQNGNSVSCDFMNRTLGSSDFSRGDGYTRSSLPLKNGRMDFILPDEGVGVDGLLASPQKMEEIFTQDGDKNGEVVWSVPKFGYDSGFKLKDALERLGVVSAFKDNADFSGITANQAFITDVTQETHVSIDENGVEAAAFTRIDYCGAAMPDGRAEMILNRPFIYGITASNGTILFIGVCRNPAS